MTQINEEDFLRRIQAGDKIEAADAMPAEYRRTLLELLDGQADSELSGAYNATEWIAKAPSIQEKVIVAQIIKDEVRHAAVFYQCLEELGVDVENRVKELDQAYDSIHKGQAISRKGNGRQINCLNFRIKTWAEFVVVNFCLDRYSAYPLKEFETSSYNPFAKACESVLKEERVHIRHGDLWVERLAKDPNTRQEVQQALDKWFPKTMNEFGPVDSPKNKIYTKWRLMVRGYNELREDFHKEIKERAVHAGLRMPVWTPRGSKKDNAQNSRLWPKIQKKFSIAWLVNKNSSRDV